MPIATAAPSSLADLAALMQGGPLAPVLAALERGESVSIDGAWGSSSALAAAALAAQAPATVLVVIAHPRDLDAWAADLESFSGIEPAILPASMSLTRQGRPIRIASRYTKPNPSPALGRARQRSRSVSSTARHRDRSSGNRLRRRPGEQPHSALHIGG